MTRILVLVDQKENRRLLAEMLARRYEVVAGDKLQAINEVFDLCITDGVMLDRLSHEIIERKAAAQPLFLPVLLITPRQDIGLASQHLWRTVDELITTPIEKLELQARVETLMRARGYSLEMSHINEHLHQEIAVREQTEETLRFLEETSTLLASSLDYEATLNNLASRIVPALADSYAVDIYDQRGKLRRVAAAAVDSLTEHLLLDTLKYPPPQTKLTDALLVTELNGNTSSEGYWDLAKTVSARSFMVLPLKTPTRTLGNIFMALSESRRPYNEDQLAIARELARRAAQAIDNAKLHQEAQEALNSRDEFLSVAAHELRTPITGIRGFAQVLLARIGKMGSDLPPSLRQGIQRIDEQSEKITRLINRLLDVSRIQAGRLELERQQVDLVELIRGVTNVAQNNTTNHTITLATPQAASGLFDPMRLEQVLTNLLDNAIKYSPNGGLVRVELAQPTPQAIQITVTDQGMGIPPIHREHIFDQFYQAKTGQHSNGIGLGLYICRQIVTLHGGNIFLEAPAEGGSRFVINLPTHFVQSSAD